MRLSIEARRRTLPPLRLIDVPKGEVDLRRTRFERRFEPKVVARPKNVRRFVGAGEALAARPGKCRGESGRDALIVARFCRCKEGFKFGDVRVDVGQSVTPMSPGGDFFAHRKVGFVDRAFVRQVRPRRPRHGNS